MSNVLFDARAVIPPPAGRVGRWLFSLHKRTFEPYTSALPDRVTDLVDARTRKVEFRLNQPTVITFSVDGESPTAAEILELGHDVIAWRWDERTGADVAQARGTVLASQDSLSEQKHTVAYTCQDALALLKRRFVTGQAYAPTNLDQDAIVSGLVAEAQGAITIAGPSLFPGSQLSIGVLYVDPAGASRGFSGRLRTRKYDAQQGIYEAIDKLAAVIDGFDYDVSPSNGLRVWYPNRGVLNSTWTLEFGSSVSSLTRQVSSATFANYVHVLGQGPDPDYLPAGSVTLYAERYTSDANDLATNPLGVWTEAEAQTDVSNVTTLDQTAQGIRATMSAKVPDGAHGVRIPLPTYSLNLRPGAYYAGCVNLGDTVTLIVRHGRLRTNTLVRVVGLTFDIDDDGVENVSLDVGTPPQRFVNLLVAQTWRVSALERRTT